MSWSARIYAGTNIATVLLLLPLIQDNGLGRAVGDSRQVLWTFGPVLGLRRYADETSAARVSSSWILHLTLNFI